MDSIRHTTHIIEEQSEIDYDLCDETLPLLIQKDILHHKHCILPKNENYKNKQPSVLYSLTAAILASLLQFGVAVSYFSISAMAPKLKHHLGLSSQDIAYLYSAYHLPNLVFVFLGGLIADRIGSKNASIIFNTLTVSGTLITCFATNLHVMLAGRFLFGMGAESLCITQMALLSRWFRIPRGVLSLPTTFALSDVFNRLGSIFSFTIVSYFAIDSMFQANLCIVVMVAVSFISNILLIIQDKHAVTAGYLDPEIKIDRNSDSYSGLMPMIKSLPYVYWVLLVICVTTYSSILTFTDFAVDFLHESYGLGPHEASKVTSSITVICLISGPLAGIGVDRMGQRLWFMISGTVLLVITFAILIYGSVLVNPLVFCLFLGVSISLISSSLWSSIPLICPPEIMNSVFGIMQTAQNCGLFLTPMIIGHMHDQFGSYRQGFYVLLGIELVSLLFLGTLYIPSNALDEYLQMLTLSSKGLEKIVTIAEGGRQEA